MLGPTRKYEYWFPDLTKRLALPTSSNSVFSCFFGYYVVISTCDEKFCRLTWNGPKFDFHINLELYKSFCDVKEGIGCSHTLGPTRKYEYFFLSTAVEWWKRNSNFRIFFKILMNFVPKVEWKYFHLIQTNSL